MSSFHHNLMGVGMICDHNHRVLFEKKVVTVFSQDNNVLLRSRRKKGGVKLW